MTTINTVPSIDVGSTVEIGTLRIHRYMDHLVLWDLTNAGKRGKKVQVATVSPAFSRAGSHDTLNRVSQMLGSFESFERALTTLKSLNEGLTFDYREERGVDVQPAGFLPIDILTSKIRLRVGYKDFSITDLTDLFNEPTVIPAIKGGLKSIPKLYCWVRENRALVETLSFREILNNLQERGIEYHYYCAVD